ncbi:glycosyltransferase family 2 protein [Sanguibacter sp. Leaf3]|uniref:glycosyltransferase family 2 protein n=1 Tax=Sanguibacter sp. Leaf3 TaxID=1736209 RepID=UPI0006F9D9A7|nr:glycosyltransferase family 2 protein [Sanguibacter sp. Leaf3]KQT95857.1 hypothetical protein ASG53_18365 [Sanguibacter sp. Leaf3]
MSEAHPAERVPDGAADGTQPVVDVVIAVHTAQRPVARAVASVLDCRAPVRVTVVAHHVEPALIEANLAPVDVPDRSSVRVLALSDGTRSPAGPFNRGLDAATAPFVAVMGSDDRLEPGALDSWVALQRRTGAAVVIARLAHAAGAGAGKTVPTPPARPFRSTGLDGVLDRLSYRSAPLGLVERATLDSLGLRFTPGLEVGEDVEVVTRLWFSGAPIAFDRRGPAYLVQDDAGDRITHVSRPVADELEFVRRLVAADWFRGYTVRQRAAAGVKLLRIHVFGVLGNRDESFWDAAEREELALVAQAVLQAAPGCERVMSHADRAVLDAVVDPAVPGADLLARARARRRHGRPATLVPRDLRMILAREAPLRLMASSVLV